MSKAFFDSYNGLADIQRREREDERAVQQNALARQAGGQIAGGDFSGGANTLYRGGQLEAGSKVADMGVEAKKREAEGLTRFTEGVQKVREQAMAQGKSPQEANAIAWAAGDSYWEQLGLDPADRQLAKQQYDQNPDHFLAFTNAHAQKELKVYQSGGHIRGLDTRTGKEQWAYDMPQADQGGRKLPGGFRWKDDDSGDYEIDPNYVQGRAALSKATRAPLRVRSGGRGGGPKLPSGFILD